MDHERSEHLQLDRETVEVHRAGDPNAPAILYSHSIPSSGQEASLVLRGVDGEEYQTVAITRPGYGNSTVKAYKNLQAITEDTLRVLDQLNIKNVYAVGTSGGAKDALSLANTEPDRVAGVTVLSSLPPFENPEARKNLPLKMRAGFRAINMASAFAESFFVWLAKKKVKSAQNNPEGEINTYLKSLSHSDKILLSDPDVHQAFVDIISDWSSSGTGKGLFYDVKRAAAPWGFDPTGAHRYTKIIHGGSDAVVPWDAAKVLAKNASLEPLVDSERGHAAYAYPDISDRILRQVQSVLKS